MSHIYNYSKELVSITTDPKERADAIRLRRGATEALVIGRKVPRTDGYLGMNYVTVPVTYLLRCRIAKWRNR